MFVLLCAVTFLATASCQTNTPTDPSRPADLSGVYLRYYQQSVTQYVDIQLQNGVQVLQQNGFKTGVRTIIYVLGWEANAFSDAPVQVTQAYIDHDYTNQLVLDWSNIGTSVNYPLVASYVGPLAQVFGDILCLLFGAGMSPDLTELVGFSLGCHVAGAAGARTQSSCGKIVHRIFALDAALELFYGIGGVFRHIQPTDAVQTIAIHTSGGQFGVLEATCNADFYPNFGTPIQPGCNITSLTNFCNHQRAWQYFVPSISDASLFVAASASSALDFKTQTCAANAAQPTVYMGDKTGQSVRGTFYLTTNADAPYGKGTQGLCP